MKGSYLFPRVKPLLFETKTLDFVEILAWRQHIVKILARRQLIVNFIKKSPASKGMTLYVEIPSIGLGGIYIVKG